MSLKVSLSFDRFIRRIFTGFDWMGFKKEKSIFGLRKIKDLFAERKIFVMSKIS